MLHCYLCKLRLTGLLGDLGLAMKEGDVTRAGTRWYASDEQSSGVLQPVGFASSPEIARDVAKHDGEV